MPKRSGRAARAVQILAAAGAAAVIVLLVGVVTNGTVSAFSAGKHPAKQATAREKLFQQGKQIFRYDTFGDETFWSGALQLDKAIEGAKLGGVGGGVSPKTALAVGLKVDATAIPKPVAAAIKAGKVNLDDPAVTLTLLKLNAVLGVKGFFDAKGQLASIGLTCAVCHSTVDDSFAPGIGKRLDGWPNQDLNVGAIVSLAPNLKPVTDLLGVDEPTLKKVLGSWGPGMFDAEVFLDGKAFRPDGGSAATRIPAAYGHAGENLHTWEGGWGTVTYWNAFVANLELHGQGNFNDARLNDATKYPVAARSGQARVRHAKDLVTPKLAALQYYQLSLAAPKPPASSYDHAAAKRGEKIFNGQGRCSDCHMPPLYTDAGYNAHKPAEICTDAFQADRGPDGTYVTQQLGGLFSRSKRGFYHDGRFKTLGAVVDHYDSCLDLGLDAGQKSDLVQFLKSL